MSHFKYYSIVITVFSTLAGVAIDLLSGQASKSSPAIEVSAPVNHDATDKAIAVERIVRQFEDNVH